MQCFVHLMAIKRILVVDREEKNCDCILVCICGDCCVKIYRSKTGKGAVIEVGRQVWFVHKSD